MSVLDLNPLTKDEQFVPITREVDRGLGFMLFAYLSSCVVTGLALIYFWAVGREGWVIVQQRFGENSDAFRDLLIGGICLMGLLAYLFLIVGQWWSLASVSRQSAKETLFISLILFLLGTVFFISSALVGGVNEFLEWQRGLRQLHENLFARPAFTLKVCGVGMYLLWFCCFNHFLGILGNYSLNQENTRKVDFYLIYICGLFGATMGILAFADQLEWKELLQGGLIVGWVVCVTWHIWRLQSVRARIRVGLKLYQQQLELGNGGVNLGNTPQRLSGVRRVLESINKKLQEEAARGTSPLRPPLSK